MFTFKDGVPFKHLSNRTWEAMQVVSQVYSEIGRGFIITSTSDGIHSTHSYHYSGFAFDCRTRHLTGVERLKVYARVKEDLSRHSEYYDVVLEKTHLHVEFDYRRYEQNETL